MVFHQQIGHAAQVQIDVMLAKVIVMSIVIALQAFNVEQTIVIETSRRLEVIGTAWQTVVLVIEIYIQNYQNSNLLNKKIMEISSNHF